MKRYVQQLPGQSDVDNNMQHPLTFIAQKKHHTSFLYILVWKNLVTHIMVKIKYDQFLDLLGFVLSLKLLCSNCSADIA